MEKKKTNTNLGHGKLPPQAVKVEESILGGLLSYPDLLMEIIDILSPSSFYKEANQKIYYAIIQLNNASRPIDMLTVIEQLKKNGDLDIVGGMYYISQLTNAPSSQMNILEHSRIVKEKEIARDLIRIGSEIVVEAYDETFDVFETTEKLINEAYNVSDITDSQELKSNAELLLEDKAKIELAKTVKGITGIPTGIKEVDDLFGGYQNSDLIIKAARPSVGKTAQAICEANHMAFVAKKTVLFFSIEMSAQQLMRRFISVNTEIPLSQMQDGNMTQDDWKRYNAEASRLTSDKLIIDDRTSTLNGIKKVSKKLSLKRKIDIIYIDYLQFITHRVEKGRSKENEVSEISKALKMLAKELNIPIVCLSQLNRAVETRGGAKKPMLSDLRDSGSIEQDADIVQFLYRPEYHGITEDEDGRSMENVAYMIVAKNRNGAVKDVEMTFLKQYTKFQSANIYKTENQHSGINNTPPPPSDFNINKTIEGQKGDGFELSKEEQDDIKNTPF